MMRSLLIALVLICTVGSSKILIINFAYGVSHFRITQKVGKTLSERGHDVTYLLTKRVLESHIFNDSRHRFTFVHYSDSLTDQEYSAFENNFSDNVLGNFGKQRNAVRLADMQRVLRGLQNIADSMLQSDTIEKLKKHDFDLVFFESYGRLCSCIPIVLGVPFVTMSTMSVSSDIAWQTRAAINTAYVPTYSTGNDEKMNFSQRCTNTVTYFWTLFQRLQSYRFVTPTNGSHLRLPAGWTISEFLGHAEIWFVRTHFALDYAKPLPANAVQVGGILAGPSKPLEMMLESFIQGSGDNGAIIFSFGTFIKFGKEEHVRVFLEAFKELPQRIVMKSEYALPKTYNANNIMTLKWLPQNDLLGHPKTKLLIYHCGSNGVFEALYHAVPVICIPLFEDQFDVARRVVSKEIGIQLDLRTLTREKLLESIQHVLNNPKYQTNMNRLSGIFRDEPLTPIERVIYWMEYVIRHGGAQHLRSAAHDLNFIQYYQIDIMAVVALIFFLSFHLVYFIIKFCVFKTILFCKRKNSADTNANKHKSE